MGESEDLDTERFEEWKGSWREIPRRWAVLVDDIRRARTLHLADPSSPLHKIGRFDAIAYCNHGGFGIVFRAADPELDRRVALKLCLVPGAKAGRALLDEAKLMARLTHPNVVTVYETGYHGEDLFFVMEYVEGTTGLKFIYRDPVPHWTQVLALYRRAGAGLAAAHDRGIVHGDFKPNNILVDADDWPRVTDFGLAQLTADDSARGSSRRGWTPAYTAPEVLHGGAVSPGSDQWSFCVSLWQSIYGQLPFVGGEPEELLAAIEQGPQGSSLMLPPALAAVLRVGLAVAPSERYASMNALLVALREVEGDGSRRARRTRRGLSAAVASLLMTGGLVLYFVAPGPAPLPLPPPPVDDLATAPPPRGCMLEESSVVTVAPEVSGICTLIRVGEYDQANVLLDTLRKQRKSAGEWQQVAAEARMISSTYNDEASIYESREPQRSSRAKSRATYWEARADTDIENVSQDGEARGR